MRTERIQKLTLNQIAEQLGVNYSSLWNAERKVGMLKSCERDMTSYLVPDTKMHELRVAASVHRTYGVAYQKAWQMVQDGFIPPVARSTA